MPAPAKEASIDRLALAERIATAVGRVPAGEPGWLSLFALLVVARDGIEPPPAFSGLLTDNAKWFRISAGISWKRSYERVVLGLIGMI